VIELEQAYRQVLCSKKKIYKLVAAAISTIYSPKIYR